AARVAQLVLHAGPDIAERIVLARPGRAARDCGHLLAQCLGLGRPDPAAGEVFDVDGAKPAELDREVLQGLVATRIIGHHAYRARDRKRVGLTAAQRIASQLEGAPAVVETGLVDRYALVPKGFVDLDGGGEAFPGAVVGNLYFAREQAGHPRRIVFDDEFLQ